MSTLPTTVLDEPRIREKGKGYLRRSAFFVPFALGIRENTRMTVTVREELFIQKTFRFNFYRKVTALFRTGLLSRLYFFKVKIFKRSEYYENF